MVPCVPIMIMLYTKAAINNFILKYLKRNINKNGANKSTMVQLMKDSQFFLSLKTFNLEKNSLMICPDVGFEKFPSSSVQPYVGGCNTLFIKLIN